MDQPKSLTSNTTTDDEDAAPLRWAGVDWSWSEHAICVIDDAGAAVERETVKHSAAGLAKLITLLHRHHVRGVAIERGDGPECAPNPTGPARSRFLQ